MKLLLLAGSKAASAPETREAQVYLKRAADLGRRIGVKDAALVEVEERKGNWLDHVPKGGVLLALDERGQQVSSAELAAMLGKYTDQACPAVVLAIGAADGLPAIVKKEAAALIAFGRATWPHMLVRVMAAEQLYRAITILTGHPYHRP